LCFGVVKNKKTFEKLTLDFESPEEFYSEELSTETPEPGEIEEIKEQSDKVEYSENDTEYSKDELEDESEIDEQQSPEQTGKNIFKSYKVQ